MINSTGFRDRLISLLEQTQGVRVVPFDLDRENLVILDLTENNPDFKNIDPADPAAFSQYISSLVQARGARAAIGRYNENRTIYDKSAVFGPSPGTQQDRPLRRTLHIGLDLWAQAGTPVLAALDGKVHSFQDNRARGDYGPTIILEHEIQGVNFYTLYGHLNRESLQDLARGRPVQAGSEIARMGDIHENGHWPPHLHFEIIRDMQGMEGDFPGVCSMDRKDEFLWLCPDPNLLLKIKNL
ncbi:MAG: peptidoglycan DD-metalloendopeptidase family protein [Desulfonatronovibrionaceae bacterium]